MPSIVRGILQIALFLCLLGAASIFIRELVVFLRERRPKTDRTNERSREPLHSLAALESELE